MAYTTFEDSSANHGGASQHGTNDSDTITLDASQSGQLALPDGSYVTEADMLRDGIDLVLQTPEGTVVIEGYFAQEPPPSLVAPDGKTLTPDLVESFTHSPQEYARSNQSADDVSPVGAVQEITGEAHVIHTDGTIRTIGVGTHIYQGDIIETEENGAVNIMFIDETTFAISEDARLAIDEYVFDSATQSGTTNFSVLKGIFVFTSGLIGREDPDDVMIDTPSGSIGIRGTIIAGNVDTGEITVIEGAIVLYDFNGNSVTLSNQYETARFNTLDQAIDYMGELSAGDIATKFTNVSNVSGDLFSYIEDSAIEAQSGNTENVVDSTESENTIEEQAVDTSQEQVETMDIITSDEITDSSVEDLSNDNTDIAQNTSPETVETTTNTASDTTETETGITPPDVDTSEQPTFYINVTPFHVPEGATGVIVAHVTGNFTDVTYIKLLGLSSNFYQVERLDANNFVIRNTVTMDAEDYHPLNIAASNDLGTSVITQTINLDIGFINEPIDFLDVAGTIGYNFTGSNSSTTIYNMSQEFQDPEGRINNYTISNLSSNINFDAEGAIEIDSNGQLIIALDNTITPETFTFDITVHSWDGQTATQQFTYDVVTSTNHTGSVFDTTVETGTVYNTDATTIDFLSLCRTVFANSTDTDKTVTIDADLATVVLGGGLDTIYIDGINANVKAGDGYDHFYINDNDYNVYGEGGNDRFESYLGKVGNIYGGEGNDRIYIDGETVSSLSGTHTFDGGIGYDTLIYNDVGNVDFSIIPDGVLHNLEQISLLNNQTNTIDLTYNDVVDMTDNDNVLFIRTDTSVTDTVNFHSGPNTFVNAGVTNHAGNDYRVLTDGNITLLVDTDASINMI